MASAADVPGKYDLVLTVGGVSTGYVFLDTLEESIPFRTHRAVYGQTQPFVERQNVSNSYGDNAQDFFLTVRQRDWSDGEGRRFFHVVDGIPSSSFWQSTKADISVPGQVSIMPATKTVTFAAAVSGVGTNQFPFFAASSTNLYEYDGTTITDRGAHGAGGLPTSIAFDGLYIYLAGTSTTALRRYDTAAHTFSTFNAATYGSITFLNNALWATGSGALVTFDTAGTATTVFTWKTATGTALGNVKRIIPFGGQIAVLTPSAQNTYAAEVWVVTLTGAQRIAELPRSFSERSLCQANGIIFIVGSEFKGAALGSRTAVYYILNGTLGKLWSSPTYTTGTFGGQDIVPYQNGLLFTDIVSGTIKYYDLGTAAVTSMASWTPTASDVYFSATGSGFVIMTQNATTTTYFFDSTSATSATLISSLIDFDSSLSKVFLSATVEFDAATDGNGGSLDLAYQLNGLAGSWTSLATGVTSGTEATFPAATTGHSVAIRVTLNKGSSTAGPTLKSMSVRGAPTMPIYPRGEYILDNTNTVEAPRYLRDGSLHPVLGADQVTSLIAARNSTTPITITDKVNGTYTGYVDVSDPEGFDVYEVHPNSFVTRFTSRGI